MPRTSPSVSPFGLSPYPVVPEHSDGCSTGLTPHSDNRISTLSSSVRVGSRGQLPSQVGQPFLGSSPAPAYFPVLPAARGLAFIPPNQSHSLPFLVSPGHPPYTHAATRLSSYLICDHRPPPSSQAPPAKLPAFTYRELT